MQTRIASMQELNEQDYLRNIANHIVTSCGDPANWGSTFQDPKSLGFSVNDTYCLYDLDIDKITRLNDLNMHALSYYSGFTAARLDDIAFGISVSQMLDVTTKLVGNVTLGNVTEYTFQITVNQDSGPVKADLHSYFVVDNFTATASNSTSSLGIGQISIDVPNSCRGSLTLLVFAKSSSNDRLISFSTFTFQHMSEDLQTNHTFVSLSPLNYTLSLKENFPDISVEKIYAFTYNHQSNLPLSSSNSSQIPLFTDSSPIVLLVQGKNGTTSFNEVVSYPQVPLTFGADFSRSETNTFDYLVSINNVPYKLTLLFGDVAN
jgi:hypothetical protein